MEPWNLQKAGCTALIFGGMQGRHIPLQYRRNLRKAPMNTPVHERTRNFSDTDSEKGEEEEDDTETANDNLHPTDSPHPTSQLAASVQTSSFGHAIRPPKRYIELDDIQ